MSNSFSDTHAHACGLLHIFRLMRLTLTPGSAAYHSPVAAAVQRHHTVFTLYLVAAATAIRQPVFSLDTSWPHWMFLFFFIFFLAIFSSDVPTVGPLIHQARAGNETACGRTKRPAQENSHPGGAQRESERVGGSEETRASRKCQPMRLTLLDPMIHSGPD